jgi:putative SOS response-associated peptidase YedK
MCGRYTQMRTWAELLDLYGIAESLSPSNFPARYNIAPTQAVPVVRQQQGSGERELVTLRWGLVPSWAKDIAIGARMINARAETLADKPSFRAAFKERRCLIVADGFYEWQARPKGPKQPWFITVEDARPFAFAGLWEEWWDAGSTLIETCTIVTTEANAALRPIHARMPAILPPAASTPGSIRRRRWPTARRCSPPTPARWRPGRSAAGSTSSATTIPAASSRPPRTDRGGLCRTAQMP